METRADLILRKAVTVPQSQDAAFRLFTDGIASWWPIATHSVGESATLAARFEGGVGGHVSEVTPDGAVRWGTITAWDPPASLSMTWHPGLDEALATQVTVRFMAVDATTTRVELEHSGWERRGAEAGDRFAGYDTGWDFVLGCYVERAGG
jgi:uncharacterized protein YndB with AHSA1/START domain